MHKAKTLWGGMGSDETRYKTWGGGCVYWNDVSVLAESCHGDQMTQCMVRGKTEDFPKKRIICFMPFCMLYNSLYGVSSRPLSSRVD